jgi:signal transduction histidine kinase
MLWFQLVIDPESNETRIRTIIDVVLRELPAAVVVVEAPSGRLLAGNRRVTEIFRYDDHDLREFHEWRGFHEDGQPYEPAEWPIARALHAGETIHDEQIVILRGDGTRGVISISAAPIRDDRQQIIAGALVFFDITGEHRRQRNLALISRTSEAASTSNEIAVVLRNLARSTVPLFADLVFLYLVDEFDNLDRYECAANDPILLGRVLGMWERFPPQLGPLLSVISSGTPFRNEQLRDSDWDFVAVPEQRKALMELGIRSTLAVPLKTSTSIVGVMTFALTGEARIYDENDIEIAAEVARHAAAAIERAHLAEAERLQRDRVLALQALTTQLAAALSEAEVSQVIIREAAEVLGAVAAMVLRIDDDGEALSLLAGIGIDDEQRPEFGRVPLTAASPVSACARERRPIWMSDRAAAKRDFPGLPGPWLGKAQAWALLPLLGRQGLLGVLRFSFDAPRRFVADEREFMMTLAGQCALALERAGAFESERRARLDAEEANRVKDDFLTVVSHELRTPLTSVIGWADLLLMSPLDEQTGAGVQAIRRSATTQASLIEDLLDVARMASGKLTVHRRPYDLASVVREAVSAVEPSAREKQLELVSNIPVSRVSIDIDPLRMRQVVANLLGNAIKFTRPGGRIVVSLETTDEQVEIRVQDSGEGIAPDFLPHVFERFRQASRGASRAHSGLGLGLAIVSHIVQLHDGTVTAESEGLGHGATFIVRLPRSRGTE